MTSFVIVVVVVESHWFGAVNQVVWTLTLMLAINHIIACCWYGVATLTEDGSTWLAQVDTGRVNVYEP
jgi:hypothetical protein